jgi:hypothetical protein
LRCFEDHLYDMLVAMIFRGRFGVEGKEEDIHSGHGDTLCIDRRSIRFYALWKAERTEKVRTYGSRYMERI